MNPYSRPPPTNPLRFLAPLLAVGLVAFSLYHLAALPGPSSLSDLPAGDDNVRSPSPPQRPLPNPLPPSGLKQKLNIGTFNLRFDGQADQTPKIGDKDDGMLDRGGGGLGERVRPSPKPVQGSVTDKFVLLLMLHAVCSLGKSDDGVFWTTSSFWSTI